MDIIYGLRFTIFKKVFYSSLFFIFSLSFDLEVIKDFTIIESNIFPSFNAGSICPLHSGLKCFINSRKKMDSSVSSSTILSLFMKSGVDLAMQAAL